MNQKRSIQILEHALFEGITSDGMKFEASGIDIYEFSGEKIQQLIAHAYYFLMLYQSFATA